MATKNFNEIKSTDPKHLARVAEYKREALAEHVAESLAQLRSLREITQVAIAAELDTPQSNVSRMEHQEDLLLSTVRAYVEALGGRLELSVVFGDGQDLKRVLLEV